jgi:hypothetical protein
VWHWHYLAELPNKVSHWYYLPLSERHMLSVW